MSRHNQTIAKSSQPLKSDIMFSADESQVKKEKKNKVYEPDDNVIKYIEKKLSNKEREKNPAKPLYAHWI